ncbi:MAG: hypothetical protein WC476_01470 [Phycisphaerae bacterium]|jgi:hypothetical protein
MAKIRIFWSEDEDKWKRIFGPKQKYCEWESYDFSGTTLTCDKLATKHVTRANGIKLYYCDEHMEEYCSYKFQKR